MTAQGQIAGTPSYLAPEQALAKPCDARTDVYTFGVLAYQMLSGALPFEGKNDLDVLSAHIKKVPQRFSGAPQPLVDLVMRCLEKKPEDRPRDGQALVDALA
jgi:serine/threonine-protein kinase